LNTPVAPWPTFIVVAVSTPVPDSVYVPEPPAESPMFNSPAACVPPL
jgi:hypothetical protein